MTEITPFLTCFGNPLLDITLVVKDTKLHKTFNLPVDGQLEVNSSQRKLFDIIMKSDGIELSSGGCALNSSSVFSWVLGERNKVAFVGGIGTDEQANKLKNIIDKNGIVSRLIKVKDLPTGVCAALVLGAQRCLSADIGAASVCGPEDVFTPDILALMNASSLIYVEGYFITHSFKTALKIAQYCQEKKKVFIFNLCASYVCENFSNELSQILPFVDILFGYIDEYETLHKFVNLTKLCSQQKTNAAKNIISNIGSICSYAFKKQCADPKIPLTNTMIETIPEPKILRTNTMIETIPDPKILRTSKSNTNSTSECLNGTTIETNPAQKIPDCTINKILLKDTKEKSLVVITQGPNPVLYASGGQILQKDVMAVDPKEIVDTTGAGDSFIGGFLAAFVKEKSLEESLDCASWTAKQFLKQRGCTLPSHSANFL